MGDQISFLKILSGMPPRKTFIYTEQNSYSYKDSINKIGGYISFLVNHSITSGYAAVLSGNNPEVIFLIIAMWEAGVVPVMINSRLTGKEIEETIQSVQCRIVFYHKDINYSSLLNFPAVVFPFSEKLHRTKSDKRIAPNDPAVIIFTSGSTAKPRAVELSFQTLEEAAYFQNKFLDQCTRDKWLASLPFYHIGGFSIITRSILLKSSMVIPQSIRTMDLCSAIMKFRPEYISIVGTHLKEMLDTDFRPPDNLKHILVGGGFISTQLIKNALERRWRISRVYGSTETAAFIAAVNYMDLRNYPDATGKEIVPNSLFILDKDENTLTESEGEIALKNIPLMNKYLNDSAGTYNKYRSNFYMTGDIGYINKVGYLFVRMRRDDMIISGGENINLLEIERIIREINGVDDTVLIPLADEKWGQIAAAVICSREKLTGDDIKHYLSSRIAAIKIPKKYFFVENIPRNEIGKVQMTLLKRTLKIL